MPIFSVRNVPKSMSILGSQTLDEQINRHPFLYSRLRRFRHTNEIGGKSNDNINGAGDSNNSPHFGNDELNTLHKQVAAAVHAADQQRHNGKQKVIHNKHYFAQLRPIVTAKCGIQMQRFLFRQRHQQQIPTKLGAHRSEPALRKRQLLGELFGLKHNRFNIPHLFLCCFSVSASFGSEKLLHIT